MLCEETSPAPPCVSSLNGLGADYALVRRRACGVTDRRVAAVEDAAVAADQMSTDARRLLDGWTAKEQASGDQRAEAEPAGVA